jgi:DNA-binding LacI/PurR family transcriptional regulator
MIAVIVFDITDPYCTHILKGIEDALDRASYFPIVVDIQNDHARCNRTVAWLLRGQVEGVIALANSVFMDLDLMKPFSERSIPSVVIGRRSALESFGSVIVDNAAGAAMGLEHLHSLGHRRIAFIRGPKMLVDRSERWEGIQAYAAQVGLKLDPELVVDLAHRSATFEEANQLVQTLLGGKQEFTAVMAFDDMSAFGAIRALTQAGIRVPGRCSVLGFDDIAAATSYNPPLTTIRQPMELMGRLAVETVINRLPAAGEDDPARGAHCKTKPSLVIRESTAAPDH